MSVSETAAVLSAALIDRALANDWSLRIPEAAEGMRANRGSAA